MFFLRHSVVTPLATAVAAADDPVVCVSCPVIQEAGWDRAAVGRGRHGAHEEPRLEVRFHVRAELLPALRDAAQAARITRAAAAAAARGGEDGRAETRRDRILRGQRRSSQERMIAASAADFARDLADRDVYIHREAEKRTDFLLRSSLLILDRNW